MSGPSLPPVALAVLFTACAHEGAWRASARTQVPVSQLEAASLSIRHHHSPRWQTRLVSWRARLDGEPLASQEWAPDDEGAPELTATLAAAVVAAGEHSLELEAEYDIYSCCYACGFGRRVTFRVAETIVAPGEGPITVCTETGIGPPTMPLEQALAPRVIECPTGP